MVNRHTDVKPVPHHTSLPPLPAIPWDEIGQHAPEIEKFDYLGPDAPLPHADIVVITWTMAEWSALDHVFLSSDTARSRYDRNWETNWHLYSKGAPEIHSEFASSPLWGRFQLVKIKNQSGDDLSVLLFKSDAHLAHPNWIDGLLEMMKHIIDDVQPKQIYSIGTAGGSSVKERLGDTAITNSGHIELKKPENVHVDWNNTTITCKRWFPSLDLISKVEDKLLFPLNKAVTTDELNYLLYRLHDSTPGSENFGLDDLVNEALDPKNLKDPKGLNKKDIPLLTTDFYYIASGDDASKYCVLEMDDTVVGHAAGKAEIDYAFLRNVSDPVVPATTSDGKEIPSAVRDGWSGLIYQNFGLYTSFNGALLTWATIAGAESDPLTSKASTDKKGTEDHDSRLQSTSSKSSR